MKTKIKTIVAIAGIFLSALATSSFAQLTIHQAVELEFPTEAGKYYQIQTSQDLLTWANFGIEMVGTGEPVFQMVSTRGQQKRFYRSVASNISSQVTIDVAAYANLSVGRRLNYRRTEDGSVSTVALEFLGTEIKNGHSVFLVQQYFDHSIPNDQFFWSTDLSKGFFETGGLNDNGQPTQETFYYQPFLPKLMKTFTPGAQYFLTVTRGGLVREGAIKAEFETITVPYGTRDCWKVTMQAFSSGSEATWTSWYAKDLGLVKREQDGVLWELESYQP